MGKSLKYVKDFDFSSAGKTVGYCGGGMKKGYAEGGKADIAQDKAMIKTAVHKHEKSMHKGEPLTKLKSGGAVMEKSTGEKYPSRSAMLKHEMTETPTMEKRESIERETVKAPAAPLGMLRDNSKLGIQGNKNPGIGRRRMPVAPKEPMIKPYKDGGKVKKNAYADGGPAMPPTSPVVNRPMPPRGKPTTLPTNPVVNRPMQPRGPMGPQTVKPRMPGVGMMNKGGLMSEKGSKKVEKVMGEYKSGELHSGSKTGPVVKNPKQAVAIALSEARNVGKKKM
jgi:Family of unknown function (DUF6496)